MNIMLDIQQKRKVRAVVYHRITLVALAVIVLVVFHSTWVVYQKKAESEKLKNISLANMDALKQRDEELQSKIDRLNTISGVEEEIRSKFSVVKDKENMVVIVDETDPVATATPQQSSFWQKIVGFFTGN